MKKEALNKFQKLSKEELEKIEGGWKLFGTETTPIEGSNCIDSVAGCCQYWVAKTYFLGIVVHTEEVRLGCSNLANQYALPQCESCQLCN
jgi:bacteriocin-like protein